MIILLLLLSVMTACSNKPPIIGVNNTSEVIIPKINATPNVNITFIDYNTSEDSNNTTNISVKNMTINNITASIINNSTVHLSNYTYNDSKLSNYADLSGLDDALKQLDIVE